MGYTYKIGVSQEEYDQFVRTSAQANLLQSSAWSLVKSDWKHEQVGFYKDGVLVATASLLVRRLVSFLPFTIVYCPRGPIMDYQDTALVPYVLGALREIGRRHRAICIKFDPFVVLAQALPGQEKGDDAAGIQAIDHLKRLGCKWSGRAVSLEDTLQPSYHAVLYRECFGADYLKKQVRQQIRTARNKGIQIQFGREELLEDFASLMRKTETRKGIHLRGKDYFQTVLAAFPEDAYLALSSLDLAARKQALLKEKDQSTESTTERLDRINQELEELEAAIQKGRTSIPLAGTLTVHFAGTSELLYAGMDDRYRSYQAALLTWFETASYAFDRGAVWHNLGGVEPSLTGGLYGFKSKLSPRIEEYIGEFDLVVSPVWHALFRLVLALKKKIRSKR